LWFSKGDALRILVVRLSAMGDVANTAYAVWALRRRLPDARIEWLVESRSADLVEALPFVDQVLVSERRRWQRRLRRNPLAAAAVVRQVGDLALELRYRRYDVALDFQGNFRSGLLVWLSGARARIGFGAGRVKEASHIFYTRKAPLRRAPLHRVERAYRLAAVLGAVRRDEPPPVRLNEADVKFVERFFYEQRVRSRPVVVLHPGTSRFGAFKRWEPERYGELARLLRRRADVFVAVTWGGDEWFDAVRVAQESGDAAVVAPRFARLGQLAALLARASLVIGGDTGPLHLAALLGRPTVAVFGPKDPRLHRPWGDGHRVVRADVPCSPCRRRRCSKRICIRAVGVGMVEEAALAALAEEGVCVR